jgi:hypothetical protein
MPGTGGTMGIFSSRPKWETYFRLRGRQGAGRGFLGLLFWLWGVVGLFFNAGSLMGLTGSVGVGTSAYLTATSLIWIGGMVLFGIGAVLANSDFDGERPLPQDPDEVRITR